MLLAGAVGGSMPCPESPKRFSMLLLRPLSFRFWSRPRSAIAVAKLLPTGHYRRGFGTCMMGKRIVVLFDGTWNVPAASVPDGTENASNIYRIWRGMGGPELDLYPPAIESAATSSFGSLFYIRGVGTSGNELVEHVNGVTGAGVIERIAIAYRWLCSTYRPGDMVLVFGFSRGAFSARSFCSLLAALGCQPNITLHDAKSAVCFYLDGETEGKPVDVQYLGIFDTVGSTIEREQDHRLSPTNVKFVRHALALDEKRKSFWPTFWSQREGRTDVQEVWFVGAHSNVGGGYADKNLSNIAQFWILRGLEDAGIPIDYKEFAGFSGERPGEGLMDSWYAWINKLPPISKAIAKKTEIHQRKRIVPSHHRIHQSVFEALEKLPSYRPTATFSNGALTASLKTTHLAPWGFE